MTGPLSRTALIAVITVVSASLVTAVVLTVFGSGVEPRRSAGVDAYSVSAIGHQGLVRLLEKLDVPVVVSRGNSAARARGGLLIVAEPAVTDEASRDRLARLVADGSNVLVVLPKWYGTVERGTTWLADVHLLPVGEVTAVLAAVGVSGASIHRELLRDGEPGPAPHADRVGPGIQALQRVASEHLTEADALGRDGLVSWIERDETQLTVLSDPDVLNNAGLRRAENARFTIELIERLRDGGPVVIDETMHGYAQTPSLVRALLRFPLVLATLQVLVCAALAVWAAMVRFGPRRTAPPPIAPGKDFLIRNTAALLHYGGHHAHALRRYLALSVAAVRHALHAPALDAEAMTAWLERVRSARGGRISLVELERAIEAADSPARVIELADRAYRWRMEMMHGSVDRS